MLPEIKLSSRMPDSVKSIVVLIGGGHAAGKKTTAELLKNEVKDTFPDSNLEIMVIDLIKYIDPESLQRFDSYSKEAAITVPKDDDKKYPSLKPSRFNFVDLKHDLKEHLQTAPNVPQKLIIIHGLYALYDKELRDLSQMKVFMSSDPDTRLIRWIRRDVLDEKKGISLEQVITSYLYGARDEMSNFIFPTKEFADVIMPRGAELNAIRLMVDGIIPYFAFSAKIPDRLSFNLLRPSDSNDVFRSEKFDNEKGKFYELN